MNEKKYGENVIQEQHELVNQKLYRAIAEAAEQLFSAEKLTDTIYEFYKMTEETPIFRLMDSEEIAI